MTKVTLKNYLGELKTFEVDLSKATNLIIIYTKLVDDEVVYIFDGATKLYTLDSNPWSRTFDILDNIKPITVEELESLNV